MRILIIEDEKKIASFIRKGLLEVGFNPVVAHDGNEGLNFAINERFDALILDIMVPGKDGLSILKELRSKRNSVPIILLTARGGAQDRIEGLNLGADDYLPKPFLIEELIARLRAVWRRHSGEGLTLLTVGELTLNLTTREVTRAKTKIELTTREFMLLEYLMRIPGRVCTRTQLCEQVWDYHFDTSTNVVDVAIQRLRKKIDDQFEIKYIHTVRGSGYAFRMKS
jgi:two-component system, OmpR family, response regulator